MSAGFCSTCKAPVFWAITAQRKRIPLDPEPVADGNVIVVLGTAYVLKDQNPVTDQRFRSHFATCPHAGQHRRRGVA